MFTNTTKPPKKTLDELLSSKDIITGKEVIHNLKVQEKKLTDPDHEYERDEKDWWWCEDV